MARKDEDKLINQDWNPTIYDWMYENDKITMWIKPRYQMQPIAIILAENKLDSDDIIQQSKDGTITKLKGIGPARAAIIAAAVKKHEDWLAELRG